jgi:hypothetical protein
MSAFGHLQGIGPSMAGKLWDLNVHSLEALAGSDAQKLYDRLIHIRGHHIDRCVLYCLRCAIYQATHESPEPSRCLWWNWQQVNPAD